MHQFNSKCNTRILPLAKLQQIKELFQMTKTLVCQCDEDEERQYMGREEERGLYADGLVNDDYSAVARCYEKGFLHEEEGDIIILVVATKGGEGKGASWLAFFGGGESRPLPSKYIA
jgi:hypothetical protein